MITVQVNSLVGPRRDPVTGAAKAWHNGTDYGMPSGTPIMAVEAGKIIGVWLNDPLNGTALVIDHRPGLPLLSSYVHLSGIRLPDGSILNGAVPAAHAQQLVDTLVKGRSVGRAEMIGLSGGKPGEWGAGKSIGPHLHLRLKEWNGKAWVDVESVDRIDWTGVNLQRRDHGPARSTP